MAENPFAKYASAPAGNPFGQYAQPGYVPPNPMRVAQQEEERARRAAADARAAEAAERAARSEARADRAEQRAIANDAAQRARLGAPGAAKATEAHTKAAQFLGRMLEAEREYATVPADSRDARTVPGQWLHENLPGLENTFNSGDRQMSDQAARNFIAASLRQESGAAISAEEYRNQYRIFFPMPGDGPEVIAQKSRARAQAIEGFRIAAGPLAERAAGTVTPPAGADNAIPPEMQAENAAYLRQHGANLDPDDYARWRTALDEKYGFPTTGFDSHRAWAMRAREGVANGARIGQHIPDAPAAQQPPQEAPSAFSAGMHGLADTVTFGYLDEMGAGLGAMFGDGEGSFGDRYNRYLTENRATLERMRNEQGGAFMAGQLGGALIPIGTVGRLAQAGWRGAAKLGAAQGGLYGSGAANGSVADRVRGAAVGATIGTVAGAGMGAAGERIGAAIAQRAANRAAPAGREVYEAAQRVGVEPTAADVGGPVARLATAASAQSILSAGTVRRAAERSVDSMTEARARLAAQEGRVLPPDEAGQLVRDAGERVIDRSSQMGNRLYRGAEQQAQGVRVKPIEAVQVIDQHIAEAAQAGQVGQPIVDALTTMRESLTQAGGVTPTGLRSIRTAMNGLASNEALRGTNVNRIFGQVTQAATRDLDRGLRAAGRDGAADRFQLADRFWAQRVEHIDDVLEPIIGRGRSGEDISAALQQMTAGNRGGIRRLQGVLRGLSDEERGNVRATFIDRLGRAARDNGEQEAFSPARFVTQWDTMSTKAKGAVFGNAELRRALDDLATAARGSAQAQRYANHSNTGGVVVNAGMATTAMASVPAAAALGVLSYATGRILSDPRAVRIIASGVRTGNQQQTLRRLQRLGSRFPYLAADIQNLEQRLIGQPLSGPLAADGVGDVGEQHP